VARTRKIRRKDAKLECKGKHTQDRLGARGELLLGAFSGFLSGNRRPMRRVPKWEVRPDLEKPGRFPSRLEVSHPPGDWPEPRASFCCPLPVKIPAWGPMKPFSVAAARAISMRDRWRARFGGNKGENAEKPRSQVQENAVSPPMALSRVDESLISAMLPGDIFLIDKLEAAGLNSEPTFHAILACPLCGNQVLISAAQYFGFAPVMCGARACPGFFRIIDEGRFVYLPVN